MRTSTIRLCLACVVSLFAASAQALEINPIFVNSVEETWTAQRQAVIQHAIDDWEAVIGVDETYDITFDFTNEGETSYVALWSGSIAAPRGASTRPWAYTTHTIHFNADLMNGDLDNWTWFDPTPADDTGSPPFINWDALTAALHEIGHSLGFVNDFYVDDFFNSGEVNLWGNQINGSGVFDPGGLDVQMMGSYAHYADAAATQDLLMTPSIINGWRQGISPVDTAMLSLAYGYAIVPEPGTGLLLALGLLALARHRRRGR